MTQRLTISHLDAKVETLNSILGFEDVTWNTDGAITLYRAYGSTGVQQYSGTSGGVRTLMGLGTIREACIFIDGMIASQRLRMPV